jgi:hypothetical protein
MKTMMFALSASATLLGAAATADPFVDAVVSNLRSLGYEYIEIDRGLTQAKAEAVRGTQKIEVIYDIATGQILKQEYETAGPGYFGRRGVEIDFERRDYLDASGRSWDDDDDDDGRRSSSGRDDDDDDGRSGSGRDDDDDDNGRSGSGRDDDDDDHGGRSGGSSGSSGSGGSSGGGSRDDNDDD